MDIKEDQRRGALHEVACCLGLFGFLKLGKFTVDNGHQFDPTLHLTPRDIEVDSREDPSMASERFKHRPN